MLHCSRERRMDPRSHANGAAASIGARRLSPTLLCQSLPACSKPGGATVKPDDFYVLYG